jgi:hypothetical protein
MALCNLFLLIIHAAPSAEDTTVSTELVPAPFRLADSHTRLAWAKTLMYQLPQEILENVLRHTPPPASVKRDMDAVIAELVRFVFYWNWLADTMTLGGFPWGRFPMQLIIRNQLHLKFRATDPDCNYF